MTTEKATMTPDLEEKVAEANLKKSFSGGNVS